MALQRIDRTHLFQSLDTTHLPRIITISAPAGCGKSVLTQQLVDKLGMSVVWQPLDHWQRDVTRLSQCSQQVWQQYQSDIIFPELATTLTSAITLAKHLTDTLARCVRDPVLYVLEDSHHLVDRAETEQWLQTVIETSPNHIHFVLVGRQLPTLNWVEHIARGDVFAIDQSQLQFTVAEVQALASLSFAEAETLVKRYQGWAAAIRIALDPSIQQSIHQTIGADHTEKIVIDHLLSTFLDHQSLAHQQILMLASTVADMLPEHLDHMLDTANSRQHLDNLHADHFLITKKNNRFHFHDLLRDFLQVRFKRLHPIAYRNAHLKAAQWFEDQQDSEKAILHYLAAGAEEAAIRLSDEIARELYVCGYWQSLLSIYYHLSSASPRLALFASILLLESDHVAESNAALDHAEMGFAARCDDTNAMRVTLQRAANYQRQNAYTKALALVDAILKMPNIDLGLLSWAQRIAGTSYLELGDYSEAISAYQAALPIVTNLEKNHGRSNLLQDLSEAYLRSGQFEAGIAALQEVVAIRREIAHVHDLALALNNLANAFHITGDYESAQRLLEEATTLLPDQVNRAAAYVYHTLGDIYRDTGQFIIAETAYQIALDAAWQNDASQVQRIILSICRQLLWQGKVFEAQIWLDKVDRQTIGQSVEDRLIIIWLACVDLLLGQGNFDVQTIIHHLTSLQEQKAVMALRKTIGTVWYVAFETDTQVLATCCQSLIRQLSARFRQTFLVDCHQYRRLKESVKGIPDLWSQLDEIYAVYVATVTPQQAHEEPTEIITLHLNLLSQDCVTYNGIVLSDTSWASLQARSFFYCLYFYGAQTKHELSARLWQDYDKAKARNVLRDVRRRIQAVLPEVILQEEGTYLLNPELLISSDLAQFEDCIQRAQQLPERDARTESLYLHALKLHGQDGLLPHLQGTWLSPHKEHVETLYLSALLGAAKCARARQDYAGAIPLYETYLLINPYDEQVYRDIMTCYAADQRYPQIQVIYNQLEQILHQDLDLLPQDETTDLLNRLLI